MAFEPLTSEKRSEMFRAWSEKQCVQHVANTCSVSRTSVRKYRKLDKWVSRLDKIKHQAEAKTDKHLADELGGRIDAYRNILKAGINKRIEELRKLQEAGQSVVSNLTIADLDKLERLLKFLEGEPDSRPDNRNIVNVFNTPLNEMSGDDLKSEQQRIDRELKELGFVRKNPRITRSASDN